ncbi:MAG: DUF5683 domain-containing protein [Bacteroidales bacterium]|nr:DUF5683 domain-containing protein [Bacteroidales bacterium]
MRILLFAFALFLSQFAVGQRADTIFKAPKHSPTRATLYSTFLPGLGQVYNKQIWKAPVIYAAGAVVTYFAITNHKGAKKFKNEYTNRMNGGIRNPDYALWRDESILAKYNQYEQAFELSLIIGGVVYLINIIDALVYAHLFTFDINDNLSANIQPFYIPNAIPTSQSSAFGLSINFSLK